MQKTKSRNGNPLWFGLLAASCLGPAQLDGSSVCILTIHGAASRGSNIERTTVAMAMAMTMTTMANAWALSGQELRLLQSIMQLTFRQQTRSNRAKRSAFPTHYTFVVDTLTKQTRMQMADAYAAQQIDSWLLQKTKTKKE